MFCCCVRLLLKVLLLLTLVIWLTASLFCDTEVTFRQLALAVEHCVNGLVVGDDADDVTMSKELLTGREEAIPSPGVEGADRAG